MSDMSQGPGWWQASDGKWYPPEQAPGVVPPTAPPTTPPASGPPGGPPSGAGYGPPPGSPADAGYGPPTGFGAPTYGAPGFGPGGQVEDLKGARIGARAIDIALVLVFSFVVALIFGASLVATSNDDDVSTGTILLVGLLTNLAVIAYEVVMVSQSGATVGKRLLGLKIVKQDGSDLELADAIKRHSPTIAGRVLGILPVVGVIGGFIVLGVLLANLIMLLTKGSSLYDQVGDTRVVRAR